MHDKDVGSHRDCTEKLEETACATASVHYAGKT